ncbi:C-C motif chemokine 3-like 1 [Willisornis vidua]|uniref:C-C motif chemokine 3-like 1 n=1 Tax=Willisornis vidua TaxID=1566151 RepID=A0ABQ9DCP8_9PASS|nr:C-C motif chemokine 3-like 1 [Willisornis vidua]
MKTFTAALAVLFVAVLCYQVSSVPPSVDNCSPSCTSFATRPLPLRLVKTYTNSTCSPPAVIFITFKGMRVCASPEEKWVQDRMKQLENKKRHG